jgi:hypothetical protein
VEGFVHAKDFNFLRMCRNKMLGTIEVDAVKVVNITDAESQQYDLKLWGGPIVNCERDRP